MTSKNSDLKAWARKVASIVANRPLTALDMDVLASEYSDVTPADIREFLLSYGAALACVENLTLAEVATKMTEEEALEAFAADHEVINE